MKKFLGILKYVGNYKVALGANIFFNLLMIVFSLVSFVSVVPFLKILFNNAHVSNLEKPGAFEFSSGYVIHWSNYEFQQIIGSKGAGTTLVLFCVAIVVAFLLRNLSKYGAMYFLAGIRNGVVKDIRTDIYHKLVILPLSYYSEERKGNIIAKMTNDVAEIEWSVLGSLEMLFRDPMAFIIFLGTLTFMDWQLTTFVLILLPVSGLLVGRVGKSLRKVAKGGQAKLGDVLSIVEETLAGLRIIKAFNAEDTLKQKFDTQNQQHFKLMRKLFRRQYLSSPLSEFIGALVLVTILWFGGNSVLKGDGLTGEFFILYIVIFSQLIPHAKSFSEAFVRIQRGISAAERIDEILLAENKICDLPNAIPIPSLQNEIEFRNVYFSYETTQVINNISFKIGKGKTVALVGPSGGGKSTIADLIPRFYDIEKGEIWVDAKPIKEYRIEDIRNLMGIVSQQSVLFNDTVAGNIALGNPNATIQQIETAAKIANAHEFIAKLDNGYQTNIGESGGKLSGGQRQRISIARAVLKNPDFLILDEATSALDTESEKLVQDALNKLMQHRTSLIIAHRLSTIQHADIVIVIDDGMIVEQGSHDTLIKKQGMYKKLCDLQTFD